MAAVQAGGTRMLLVLAALVISTWLNTLYFMKTVITIYRQPRPDVSYSVEKGQRGFCFNASLLCFTAANISLGLFAHVITDAITRGLAIFG